MTTISTTNIANATNAINPMALIRPMAEGMIAMAMVSAMSGSFGFMGAAGAASFSNPREELNTINTKISRLSYVLENQRDAVKGHRIHQAKLMREYGFGVMPSLVEMKKYPKLKNIEYFLIKSEKDLDRMELRMTLLQKRRKELQTMLHLRIDEEEEARITYPAMKKFIPPPERRF